MKRSKEANATRPCASSTAGADLTERPVGNRQAILPVAASQASVSWSAEPQITRSRVAE